MSDKRYARLVYLGLIALSTGTLTSEQTTLPKDEFAQRLAFVRAALTPSRVPAEYSDSIRTTYDGVQLVQEWNQTWSQWSRTDYTRLPS
jgi:hypothetical protein